MTTLSVQNLIARNEASCIQCHLRIPGGFSNYVRLEEVTRTWKESALFTFFWMFS